MLLICLFQHRKQNFLTVQNHLNYLSLDSNLVKRFRVTLTAKKIQYSKNNDSKIKTKYSTLMNI